MNLRFLIIAGCIILNVSACKTAEVCQATQEVKLNFIGEVILPSLEFKEMETGGLSGIDYCNGNWYAISDDPKGPVRFYTLKLVYGNQDSIETGIKDVTLMKNSEGYNLKIGSSDPEAIRLDPENNTIIWTSEGQINTGISPSVHEVNLNGQHIRSLPLPKIFSVKKNINDKGPRQNGNLEGLSLSADGKGYWLGMELPLLQDGEPPVLLNTKSPVRITLIDKISGEVKRQYAYMLDNISRDSNPSGGFNVNGLVEILALNDNEMLVLERSYASGWPDGGNNVKLYLADFSQATNIMKVDKLKGQKYIPATKKLLFDFDTIRSQLTQKKLDNLEGMTFGPHLPNGNRSLVFISDNNFNEFGPQLNQIIVFEVVH